MSVLTPLALLLGAVLIPALILLYLLKVRRRDFEVGSTYLWTHLLRDLAAHEPWQRLHWSVLLTAQLVVVGLLVFAVARPFYTAQAAESIHAMILLDGSASMQTADVSPNRFEVARQEARRVLRELPDDSLGTLIVVKSKPEVLVAASADRQQLARAIDNATVSGGSADLQQALSLASALNNNRKRALVYLISDGAFGEGQQIESNGLEVSFIQVGMNGDNRAISTLSARPDPLNAHRYQVFARVRNYSDQPTSDVLSITADGSPADSREVMLAPGTAQDYIFNDLPVGTKSVEAKLGTADELPLDDQAYAILDVRRPAQVLLVTDGNLYLEKVMGLIPNVELFRSQPRRYFTLDADRYDLIVFDTFVPDVVPRGNLLFVNPTESALFSSEGEVRQPRIRDWERDDPLLQFVDLRDVAIAKASRLTVPSWAKALVSGDDMPLMLAGTRDGQQRIVALPFDLRQTNLPLSTAFPILMLNIMGYLEPAGQVDTRDLRPGDAVTLLPLPQTEDVQVRKPDGTTTGFKVAGAPLRYDQTALPGIYTATQRVDNVAVSQEIFAVNPSSERESDVRPRPLTLNSGQQLAAPAPGTTVTVQREFWIWLIPAALLLLLFEWWWFHRRT
jgi:von Willebrand factor type A domain/Aerotolerance regulator N-terminal